MWKWPRSRKLTQPKPLWTSHERHPTPHEEWQDRELNRLVNLMGRHQVRTDVQLRRIDDQLREIHARLDRIEGIR